MHFSPEFNFMKKIIVLFLCAFCQTIQSQSVVGHWHSKFSANLHFSIEIYTADGAHAANITVPVQNSDEDKAIETKITEDSIFIKWIVPTMAQFKGRYYPNLDLVKGHWMQQGRSTELILNRIESKYTLVRPQEPKAPFPYKIIDTSFYNPIDKIRLSGTLTIPKNKKNVPAVILVSGSGPNDRDEKILGHKPFKVIADFLTRQGIAVLRYDDRGCYKSEGKFTTATTFDFATDTGAAVIFLKAFKELNPSMIGILGHSEGGMIAPIVASKNTDVDFIISLAGPAVAFSELMAEQNRKLYSLMGKSKDFTDPNYTFNIGLYKILMQDAENEELYEAVKTHIYTYFESLSDEDKALFGSTKEQVYFAFSSQVFTPWFREIININTSDYLSSLEIPILGLYGGKDFQVDAKANKSAMEKACAGNNELKTKLYKNLNHLFQDAFEGTMEEYSFLEETIHPLVLFDIAEWINTLHK